MGACWRNAGCHGDWQAFLAEHDFGSQSTWDFHFMAHDGSVTSPTFKEFLERLIIEGTQPVFVIVDDHPIYKSRVVQDYVEGLDGQLRLFYLPPYAPHLNPDKQVWPHVKRGVNKQMVQAKDDMKKLALGALRRIQKLLRPVSAFFQQPECQYAS